MAMIGRLRTAALVWLIVGLGSLLAVFSASAQTPDPAQLEAGARLYAQNCAVCHGEDGQGRVGATLAKDWPSIRPDLTIREVIENGVQGSPMPAWASTKGGPLSSEEITSLVTFIMSWEPNGPRQIPPTPTAIARLPVTPPPGVEGDPNRGAVLYDQNCLVCHGPNGEGRVGATLAKSWASLRADLSIKAVISRGVEGSPMPAWDQAEGGPLTEQEINDIVAFVLALPVVSLQPGEAPTATPAPGPGLPGWAGVLLTLGLFILVVAVAIWLQTRPKKG